MSLELSFAGGRVTGMGVDCIGEFGLSGSYDLADGACGPSATSIGVGSTSGPPAIRTQRKEA